MWKIQTPLPSSQSSLHLKCRLFWFWLWPPPPYGFFPQFVTFHVWMAPPRGAIIKKNGKIWEKFPNGGGGKFFFKKVPISIWELCTSRGGVSIFQKCPNLNYFAIILQYYLYKKCRKIKDVWNSKKSEISDGGGVKPIWEFFPHFSVFFMMAPLRECSKINQHVFHNFGPPHPLRQQDQQWLRPTTLICWGNAWIICE